MKALIDILYMIVGIGVMVLTISVGLIGFIKVWRDISKMKDKE
jgi:hypothetical protein